MKFLFPFVLVSNGVAPCMSGYEPGTASRPFDPFGRVEQLAARQAHNLKVPGSSPGPAPISAAGQPAGAISGARFGEGASPARTEAAEGFLTGNGDFAAAGSSRGGLGVSETLSPAGGRSAGRRRCRPFSFSLGALLALSHPEWRVCA